MSALAETPSGWRYGYELSRQLGIKAGSMYMILMRLSDRGLVETAWEADAPPGRPRRHLYRLTDPGLEFAGELDETASAAQAVDRLRPRSEGA